MNAPVVVARRKTLWHPSADRESIRDALALACECPGRTVPVFHAGDVVGLVRGLGGRRVKWRRLLDAEFSGFDSYETLNRAVKNGQVINVPFYYNNASGSHAWTDYWTVGGMPVAGDVAGTADTLRQFDNTSQGGLFSGSPYLTPGVGQDYFVVASELAQSVSPVRCVVVLYDRVAAYDNGVVSNVQRNMTNTLAAQRYVGNGDPGLLVSIVCTSALGATVSNLSALHFTDNNGNTGIALSAGYTLPYWTNGVATAVCVPWDNTNATGVAPWLPLTAGVTGVRKIEDYTSSAANTGTTQVVLMHPLGFFSCAMPTGTASVSRRELSRATFALEKVFSTAALSLLVQNGNSNQTIFGKFQLAYN